MLTLINRTIIFHNYNINCKEENYSEYQRDKHVSLKILLSLPEYYYKNISEKGKDAIYDYKSVIDELVGIIAELEYVYYYYPYKNKKDFMLNNENQFYMNYIKFMIGLIFKILYMYTYSSIFTIIFKEKGHTFI